MTRRDFFTSLVLIILGIAIVAESLRMPRFENLGINPYTVPGLVPGVLGGVIVLFGVVMLVRSSLAGGWRKAGAVSEDSSTTAQAGTRRLALTLLLTLGYAGGLVGRLPFWLATLIFVFLFIALFEWPGAHTVAKKLRTLGFALLQAALVAFSVTYVFERIFLVRLP